MIFTKLNEMIPYATKGKLKILSMRPYTGIELRMPGRHGKDSDGGDYVVLIDDDNMDYTAYAFSHTDLFKDLESKLKENGGDTYVLLKSYKAVVLGADPNKVEAPAFKSGINSLTFLYAVQALAVCEHRRYAVHESKWGGRYLPLRFAAGIVEGLWTAIDAADKQKYGKPGVQQLERMYGMPDLTKKLMGLNV
jgi:hypothetical protein